MIRRRPGKFDLLVEQMNEGSASHFKESTPTSQAFPELDGKYQIEERIGGGGMGVVYRAHDARLQRTVALKFLRTDITADPEAKARLLVEAQSAAGLDHPNVCTIYEIGETSQGNLYLVMPYYQGETLQEKLHSGPLSIDETIDYITQIGAGLQQAHAMGIVHRDIKPANLLVTSEGVVKILDFGIAKRPEDQLTRDGSRLGTLAYMSPEQLQSEAVDHRTDVWALGIVLFELLTGSRPFQGEYEYALMYALLHEKPLDMKAFLPDAPAHLETAIHRALEKERPERFQSVSEFIQALSTQDSSPRTTSTPPPASQISSPTVQRKEERIQATVTLSIVGGYYELAEELTSDQLAEKVALLEQKAQQIATDHNGILHRFSAEEIMMLFGVQNSQEDFGQRAARAISQLHAILEELSSQGVDFSLTTGMVTGSIIVRGSQSQIEVTGKPISLARRLATQAEEDSIVLEAETSRLIRSSFDLEDLPPLKAGKGPAISCYSLGTEKAQAAPMRGSIERGLTHFTGRQRELDTILRSFERVKLGEGQFVTLSGEAGLGKSRLSYEFRKSISEQEATLLIGRCQTHGSRTPYLPFIEVLRMALGIDKLLAADIKAETVLESVEELSADLEAMLPAYLYLLGLEHPEYPKINQSEPELLYRALFESIVALFTTLAQEKPLVIILEDWHWSDEGSQRLLNQIIDFLSLHPVLVLVPYRPSYVPNWGHSESHVPIRLRPLVESDTVSMIQAMLDIEVVPEYVSTLLLERTEGNPFFLEELVTSLVEAKLLDVHEGQLTIHGTINQASVPNTVQAVLRSRIERLSIEERSILQAASVVGRTFTRQLLTHIVSNQDNLDNHLDAIRKLGLFQQTRVVPELEYRFKHALVQDVAYDSLLAHQRKQLHGQVATAMETLYPEIAEEQPFRIANHFAESEHWEKAVYFGEKAANFAWTTIQYEKALGLYNLILDWLSHYKDRDLAKHERIRMLFLKDQICEGLYHIDERKATLDALYNEIRDSDNKQHLCNYFLRKAEWLATTQNPKESESLFNKALEIAETLDDVKTSRKAFRSIGWYYWLIGNYQKAEAFNLRALESLDNTLDSEEALGIYASLATLAADQGRYDQAHKYLEPILEDLEETTLTLQVTATYIKGQIQYQMGNIEEATKTLEHCIQIWNKNISLASSDHRPGRFGRRNWTYILLGTIKLKSNRFEEAEALFRTAVEHQQEAAQQVDVEYGDSLMALGNCLINVHKELEGIEYLEKANAIFDTFSAKGRIIDVNISLALAYERLDNYPGAFVMWERVKKYASEVQQEDKVHLAMEGKARVARLQDRPPRNHHRPLPGSPRLCNTNRCPRQTGRSPQYHGHPRLGTR